MSEGEAGAPAEVVQALRGMGLIADGEQPRFARLTGGVSSDIWRVETAQGPICVKRALARLRVAQDWFAPVERNAYESDWMRRTAAICPDAVPPLLGQDDQAGVLAMGYLEPDRHALWKAELLAGRADPAVAAAVGDRLGRIHAATADDPEVAQAFPTDRIFYDIRLEPYLVASARAHPDLEAELMGLVEATARTRRCLVHGDVSPKNILLGPQGPVFLDAECAWFGDPAFDVAFCLNHLLLKCLHRPDRTEGFLACFDALVASYGAYVDWEPRSDLEARVARLVPGLLLARVDGKSPVEYLNAEPDQDRVRKVARALLARPADRPADVREAWAEELRA